jgi:hypothetical protein
MHAKYVSVIHDTSTDNQGRIMKDYCEMNDGTMMVVRNGIKKIMETDRIMLNGTVIKTDGSYQLMDGSKKRLNEGEKMDIAGTVTQGTCQ